MVDTHQGHGADTAPAIDAIVAETLDHLDVRADGETFEGPSPDWFGPVLFGGFLVAQGVAAVCRTSPEGRRLHSLHAYFLRPATPGAVLSHVVEPVRDGRSFSLRRLETSQAGRRVFVMDASFTTDAEGDDYELPAAPETPDPDHLDVEVGPGPFALANAGPTPVRPDGTRASTSRAWFRLARRIGDDDHVHAALLAFLSDMTLTGGRPLDLDGDTTGMVSLDHAVWFHRPARADEWLLYDVHSLVNAGGRGLLRGTLRTRDRRLVASVAQEMRLLPRSG